METLFVIIICFSSIIGAFGLLLLLFRVFPRRQKEILIHLKLDKPQNMGITVTCIPGSDTGVLVEGIPNASPLAGTDVRVGDRIVRINRKSTVGVSLKELGSLIESEKPNLVLLILRGGDPELDGKIASKASKSSAGDQNHGVSGSGGAQAKPSDGGRRERDRMLLAEGAGPEERGTRQSSVTLVAAAHQTFDKYDVDNSGTIDKAELRKLLEDWGHSSIDENMYDKFDVNKDGQYQFDEFVHIYNEIAVSSGKSHNQILHKVAL